MRVAYVGNFRPSHSTENHVAGSLRQLGHDVVEFQEDEQRGHEDSLAERVIVSGADLLLYTKTWGLDPAPTIASWERLDAVGIPTVSYHLDLYVGLDREEQLAREPFWRTRYVFSADGGSDDVFAAYGIDHEWLRAGVYGPECFPGWYDDRYRRTRVAFVGSHQRYHAEWPYRQQLVQWLKRHYRSSFGVWPQGGRAVRGQELNNLYASVPVIVGDSLCPGFTHERYWSDRVYETVGRGGFLIHPRIAGLEDEFVDGVHLRFYDYGDFDQLKSLIDYYIANPGEAKLIAIRGQAFVTEHCTYEQRVTTMLERLARKGALAWDVAACKRSAQLGRWSARYEVRGDVDSDVDVWGEVWGENTYEIDTALGLSGTVIDVGANVGAFTVLAARAGAERVVAVEPEPENRLQLVQHLRLNAVESNVDVVAAAVTDGRSPRVRMTGSGAQSRTTSAADAGDDDSVAAISLDELIGTYAPVSLLKVDIEGGEYLAFDAVPIERLRDVERIIMEFHGPDMPGFDWMRPRVPDDVLAVVDDWANEGEATPWWHFGRLVTKLAEAGRVTTIGHPSRGGFIVWERY